MDSWADIYMSQQSSFMHSVYIFLHSISMLLFVILILHFPFWFVSPFSFWFQSVWHSWLTASAFIVVEISLRGSMHSEDVDKKWQSWSSNMLKKARMKHHTLYFKMTNTEKNTCLKWNFGRNVVSHFNSLRIKSNKSDLDQQNNSIILHSFNKYLICITWECSHSNFTI